MLSLIFTLVMANENYFSFNDWDYGDCKVTKVDGVMLCKTDYQACIVDTKAINKQGQRYAKFACHVDQDVEQ